MLSFVTLLTSINYPEGSIKTNFSPNVQLSILQSHIKLLVNIV